MLPCYHHYLILLYAITATTAIFLPSLSYYLCYCMLYTTATTTWCYRCKRHCLLPRLLARSFSCSCSSFSCAQCKSYFLASSYLCCYSSLMLCVNSLNTIPTSQALGLMMSGFLPIMHVDISNSHQIVQGIIFLTNSTVMTLKPYIC